METFFLLLFPQVEPYLTTMALYDVKSNKKLTEDFHFDVNEPHMQCIVRKIRRPNNSPDDDYVSDLPNNWLDFPKQVK